MNYPGHQNQPAMLHGENMPGGIVGTTMNQGQAN